MGYWVATDLAQYLPQLVIGSYLVTPTSNPVNASQFQAIINMKSAEFDQAAAKAGYAVPIPTTASQGWITAQNVVRSGAIAAALYQIYTGPDAKYIDRYETSFQMAIKAIAAGDMLIPNAPWDVSGDNLYPIYSGIASPVFNATIGFPQDLGIPNDF